MKCTVEPVAGTEDSRGWRKVRCIHCGRIYGPTPHAPEDVHARCLANVPRPGTELKRLLYTLGKRTSDCNGKCEQLRHRMDAWGPDGCEEHLPEIATHLREAYKEQSWAGVTSASIAAFTTGLAFQLDWDPIPSLVRLAIERARNAGSGSTKPTPG